MWKLAALLRTAILIGALLACDSSQVADAGPGIDSGTDIDATVLRDGGGLEDAGADGSTLYDGGPDGSLLDASAVDAGGSGDAGRDASIDASSPLPTDAGWDAGDASRVTLIPGFCPSAPTGAGAFRGTLASNLNDIAGACGITAPGRDGAVRIEVAPGQTLRVRYRHAGDGAIYLLDSCPVVASCLAGSDSSLSGEERVEWTNAGAIANPVYLIVDSASLSGAQTFELDVELLVP